MPRGVPQVPATQKVQPKVKEVSQAPQQPPVGPQAPQQPPVGSQIPPKPTPPAKPKTGLKPKKKIVYLVFLPVLIIVGYIISITITYWNCSKATPETCAINKCDFSLSGFKLASSLKDDCCGNKICEVGETYSVCAEDCPDCDDENKCTFDSYDHDKQECVNEPILDVVCCGNTLCEEGYETNSNCPKDCPNCDDNSRLTVDSFNYETQKCENIVTHYFIEDFEEGETSIDKKVNWKIIDDQGNKVLDCPGKEINGVENDWANFGRGDWADYESELSFKLVENYEGFGFHFFAQGEQGYIVDIRGGKISLRKASPQGREDLSSKDFEFKLDEWRVLKTEKIENNIKVYIDNATVLEYTDNRPLEMGQLRLETFGDGHVRVDNISIKK